MITTHSDLEFRRKVRVNLLLICTGMPHLSWDMLEIETPETQFAIRNCYIP